jgi:hypothetical protein
MTWKLRPVRPSRERLQYLHFSEIEKINCFSACPILGITMIWKDYGKIRYSLHSRSNPIRPNLSKISLVLNQPSPVCIAMHWHSNALCTWQYSNMQGPLFKAAAMPPWSKNSKFVCRSVYIVCAMQSSIHGLTAPNAA